MKKKNKRRNTNCPLEIHETVLNITTNQGNANWNHHKVPVHYGSNGHCQKDKNDKCWWECREKGTFVHCWSECVWTSWGTVCRFLKIWKVNLPYDPSYPIYRHKSKKIKSECERITILATSSWQLSYGINLWIPQWRNGQCGRGVCVCVCLWIQ